MTATPESGDTLRSDLFTRGRGRELAFRDAALVALKCSSERSCRLGDVFRSSSDLLFLKEGHTHYYQITPHSFL